MRVLRRINGDTSKSILQAVGTLIILGMSLSAGADIPVTVHGRILLPNGRSGPWSAVWLEGAGKAEPLKNAVIDQREKTFLPHVLVVTAGTNVHFPNNDTIFHNVFAQFEAKRFDLGMYPRGTTKNVRFDKPGIVSVLCNVHASMSAYIVVVNTPYFATSSTNGDFQIKDVPPGKYTLHIWHESGAELTQPLMVTASPDPLNLRLVRH